MYPEMALLSANFSYDTVGGLQLLSKGTCTQSLYTESALIHSLCNCIFSQANCNIDCCDFSGNTPLHVASGLGRYVVLHYNYMYYM